MAFIPIPIMASMGMRIIWNRIKDGMVGVRAATSAEKSNAWRNFGA
jgi:hypothetical protein